MFHNVRDQVVMTIILFGELLKDGKVSLEVQRVFYVGNSLTHVRLNSLRQGAYPDHPGIFTPDTGRIFDDHVSNK